MKDAEELMRMRSNNQWFFTKRIRHIYKTLTKCLHTKASLKETKGHISAPFESEICDIFESSTGREMKFTSTMRYLLVDSILRRLQLFSISESDAKRSVEIYKEPSKDDENFSEIQVNLNHMKKRDKISVGKSKFLFFEPHGVLRKTQWFYYKTRRRFRVNSNGINTDGADTLPVLLSKVPSSSKVKCY
jgi:hypothetical protein